MRRNPLETRRRRRRPLPSLGVARMSGVGGRDERALAHALGYRVRAVILMTPLDVCLQRNRARATPTDPRVLVRQYHALHQGHFLSVPHLVLEP